MLRRFFHAWEHRLASVSTDRIVRPFEWGTDWLPPSQVLPSTEPAISEQQHVTAWVDAVMRDTDAFFDAGRCDDYALTGDTLQYPSALVTPHPDNNLVRARWFPSADGPAGRAVVVLPQWNSDAGGHVGLCQILARFGISALRLSLPYHDARMPPELTRADYIVSSNVARTVQVCRQAVLDARRAVAWLSGQGYERIGILGTSLGSCLAMLTSAHEPRIRAQALNHI